MTRRSILEYTEAVRGRYLKSAKKMKSKILDEFVAVTGLHRKASIRLLNRRSGPVSLRRKGRPPLYDFEVMAALKVAWEASDRLCSRRLCPFLPELVRILRAKGELRVTEEAEAQLCRLSPSTVIVSHGVGAEASPGVVLALLNQAHFSRMPFRYGLSASGKTPGRALLRLTLLPTVGREQRVSI